MENMAMVLFGAILVEAIIEVLKGIVDQQIKGPFYLWPLVSLILAIGLCIAGNIDMISLLGMEFSLPFLGNTITGLLISRGSSFLHDIWDLMRTSALENL